MAIRMSGINSGLDTDAIVQALVSAQSLKATKVQNKLTKSEWTQDAWKDLNTKLYSLYTKQLTKFKTQGSYRTKTTSSSDESIAKATASGTAADGSHTLEVKQMASAQVVTGGKISAASNKATLTSLGMTAGSSIEISCGEKTTTFEVTESSTIADFTAACKNVGLNANYDTTQKRMFISSAKSGEDNSFSITTGSIDVDGKKSKMESDILGKKEELTPSVVSTLENADKDKLKTLLSGGALENDDPDKSTLTSAYNAMIDSMGDLGKNMLNAYANETDPDASNAAWSAFSGEATRVQDSVTQAKEDLTKVEALSSADLATIRGYAADSSLSVDPSLQDAYDAYTRLNLQSTSFDSDLGSYVNTKEYKATVEAGGGDTDQLKCLGLGNITSASEGNYDINGSNMSVVKAKNAVIVLDSAELEGSSNDFNVNGLSIELKNVTAPGKSISLNTSSDVDSAYNMVKDFVKTYNSVLEELNTKFNATSAKGYDPLTDDEKEAMTDDQIEKWETKIKDSLLRKDGTLGSIINTMRQSLMVTTEVDGKKYSLASFGIKTSSDYTERGKLHIYGDEDDEGFATETNKLKEALQSNPDAVMKTLAAAGQSLYDALTKKMSKTSLSSALTFYNDKQMSSQQSSYKKQISEMQNKVKDLEDRYYKQFTAMESAMAKMNSQSSYLSSLMGMGG